MSKKRDDEERDEDEALWRYVTRDVKPLKHTPVRESKPPQGGRRRSERPTPPPDAPMPPKKSGAGIDGRSDEKLRRGQMAIDARIDLHGMGQAEAHEMLTGTLLSFYNEGLRCVLVITGKGREGKGVLKTQVPRWLGEGILADIVLRFHPAKPLHGGQGALYVLLRRKRN